jgi:mannose-6-phosphate isomerase
MARARLAGFRHPELDEVLLQGFEVMRDKIHRQKKAPGWGHLLARDGSVLDGRRVLYDQAFVLLACASLHATFQDSHFLETARVILAVMDEQMRHPAGGYVEFLDENGAAGNDPVRWQNPCMHLLEAGLALSQSGAEAGLRKRALDLAADMTGLFRDHFFNPQSDCLNEVFDSDWQAINSAEQNYFEPGHHFEWVFLLHEFERNGGHIAEKTGRLSLSEIAQRLMWVGLEKGLEKGLEQLLSGDANQTARFALDRVTHDFTRLDGRRLWPQTELLRALIIYGEDKAAAVYLQNLFDTYLQPPQADRDGLWMDSYTQDSTPTARQVPASTLYHLWGALAFYAGLDK